MRSVLHLVLGRNRKKTIFALTAVLGRQLLRHTCRAVQSKQESVGESPLATANRTTAAESAVLSVSYIPTACLLSVKRKTGVLALADAIYDRNALFPSACLLFTTYRLHLTLSQTQNYAIRITLRLLPIHLLSPGPLLQARVFVCFLKNSASISNVSFA